MTQTHRTVGELAREWNCPPRELTGLLYDRSDLGSECPVVAGRRMIPVGLVPRILQALGERVARRRGRKPTRRTGTAS